MHRTLLCALILIPALSRSQTVLFSEAFDGTPAFTLNTSDLGGATASQDNSWLVNSVYAGGNGTVSCMGFNLPFSVPNTPGQPASITSPNGAYLHITSVAAQNSGILNCCFLAADGLCASASSHFARMSTDVSTGPGDVTLSFWWLCAGGNNNYGEVYYSTDGGSTWNQISTPISQYRNQGSWVQQSITLPAFSNQAALRFGFRFVNGVTTSAQDPAFAVDDVRITSSEAAPPSVATGALAGSAYCQGATIAVPYVATGAFGAANTFTAQLSDAVGSFAAPTAIGSVASMVSGTIAGTIPANAPPGTGYRIRVVASDPALIGADNGTDLTISEAPYAGPDGNVSLCKNTGSYDLLDYMPGASACGSWAGPDGQPFSGMFDTFSDLPGVYTYTTNCPGGCPQDQATLTVALVNPANAGQDMIVSLCAGGANPPLVSYVSGGDATGIFFHNGQPATNALLTQPGQYDLIYVAYGTGPCGNDTAHFHFAVHQPPNAGVSTSATICASDPPVQLITLLGGIPQAGGVWTDPNGQPMSGVFVPGTSLPGLYTYTVPGTPPCTNAQAFVAVVVDPCGGIAEAPERSPLHYLGQQGTEHLFEAAGAAPRAIDLLDARGAVQRSWAGPFPSGTIRIDLAGMPSAAYFLRAWTLGGPYGFKLMHLAQ